MFADPLEEVDRGDVFFVGGACKIGLLTSGTCGTNVEVFSFSEVLCEEKGVTSRKIYQIKHTLNIFFFKISLLG